MSRIQLSLSVISFENSSSCNDLEFFCQGIIWMGQKHLLLFKCQRELPNYHYHLIMFFLPNWSIPLTYFCTLFKVSCLHHEMLPVRLKTSLLLKKRPLYDGKTSSDFSTWINHWELFSWIPTITESWWTICPFPGNASIGTISSLWVDKRDLFRLQRDTNDTVYTEDRNQSHQYADLIQNLEVVGRAEHRLFFWAIVQATWVHCMTCPSIHIIFSKSVIKQRAWPI